VSQQVRRIRVSASHPQTPPRAVEVSVAADQIDQRPHRDVGGGLVRLEGGRHLAVAAKVSNDVRLLRRRIAQRLACSSPVLNAAVL
jgi:hypothetical protein